MAQAYEDGYGKGAKKDVLVGQVEMMKRNIEGKIEEGMLICVWEWRLNEGACRNAPRLCFVLYEQS